MKPLAIFAVLIAGLCTTAFNWQFSYGLGRTEHEAVTWATFSVALDVAKWTMLVIAARSWPSLNAIAAVLIWITATTYSFTAALGFAATSRAQQELEGARHREQRAALQSARQSPLWQSTYACTHIASRQAREYCAAVKALEARPINQPQEAQSGTLATLLNLSERTASLVLSLYLAFCCEVISALGLFAVSSSKEDGERKSSWLSKLMMRRHKPATTPASSSSDARSTASSPSYAPRPSSSSGNALWQRPRSWR